jgi:hypothetical protein
VDGLPHLRMRYEPKDTSMSSINDKPQGVDLEYVRNYLAGLKRPAWAQCREGHHSYPDKSRVSLVEPDDDSVVERTKKCRRCGVLRIETLHVDNASRTARRVNVRYENHPDGYLMEPGHGRLDSDGRNIIRYENLYNEMQQQTGGR